MRVLKKHFTKKFPILIVTIVVLVVLYLAVEYLPYGVDWNETYRPAALLLAKAKSPFGVEIFYAAPWILIPFIPIAWLPLEIGRAVIFVIGICVFAYTAYRLGAKPISMAAFLVSPPVVHCLINSNIEWLALLGVVLPPQIGLLLISAKPQIGVGIAVFWFVEAFRKGGFRQVVRVFWPVTLAFLISFALFGLWPLRFRDTLVLTRAYNASLWPASLPVGLGLLAAAIRKRDIKFSMAASPCLSPYVLLHAWVGALASILAQPVETLAAVIGLWILVIIQAFNGAI